MNKLVVELNPFLLQGKWQNKRGLIPYSSPSLSLTWCSRTHAQHFLWSKYCVHSCSELYLLIIMTCGAYFMLHSKNCLWIWAMVVFFWHPYACDDITIHLINSPWFAHYSFLTFFFNTITIHASWKVYEVLYKFRMRINRIINQSVSIP